MKHWSPLFDWTPRLYGRIARYYDFFARLFVTRRTIDKVLAGLSGTILDVACGTGTLLQAARERGFNGCGVDRSRGMLVRARAKGARGNLVEGSYYELPYGDESFDHVVETNAVGGVGIDDATVLAEMARVCKKGGEIRLLDYAPPERETWLHRLLMQMGRLFGDEVQPFQGTLRGLGLEPQVEVVGGLGMYQLVRAVKR